MFVAETWIDVATAVGTVGAAVIPGWAYFGERRERRAAQAEVEAHRAEEYRAEQRKARKMIADEVRRVRLYDNSHHYGRQSTTIRVVNETQDPVMGIVVCEQRHSYGSESTLVTLGGYPDAFKPGEQVEIESDYTDLSTIWVTFKDSRGRTWSRSSDGSVRTWYPPGFENEADSAGELYDSGFDLDLPSSEESERNSGRTKERRGFFT